MYDTNNTIPMLDQLVYGLKKIGAECIIKDTKLANKYETLESMKGSDMYLACVENRVRFEMLNYPLSILKNAMISESIIYECVEDKNKIPMEKRNLVLSLAKESYIKNYVEKNDYYRMLNGKPKNNQLGVVLPKSHITEDMSRIFVNDEFMHEMTIEQIEVLRSRGIIDSMVKSNPDLKYLEYLGDNSIDTYNARIASNYDLLRVPDGVHEIIIKKFKERYNLNVVYTLRVVDHEAYRVGSDYYDNFLQVFIILQTMIDVICELPDMIIKREIFDIKTIEILFTSHGIDFFPEIPYVYQRRMMLNIHTLLKHKSTTKNIVDICSLFGFDSIQVFKYYLLKDRNIDENGDFINEYILNEDGEEVEDLESNYDLKFIKVPIEDLVDNHLQDDLKYSTYEEIVNSDVYWDGELEHTDVKKMILEKEFNMLQSKYLSIDTIFSLTDLQFQMVYFHNMIFDDCKFEDSLRVKITFINEHNSFKITNVFSLLYALMYEYNGIADDIMDTNSKILSIKGFNFKADLAKLGEYVNEKGYTLEDLGVSGFNIPDGHLMTFNQLMNVFIKNKEIYDHIVHEIVNANNKDIYDIYYKLYDALMIRDLNNEFFRIDENRIAKSYTEYIEHNDLLLFNFLQSVKEIDSDERANYISNIINDIVFILEQYIDSDEFDNLFYIFPSISHDTVKRYMYLVINFFKSHKVQLYSINTLYKFDDKLQNKVTIIDKMIMSYIFHKNSNMNSYDKIKGLKININPNDRVEILHDMSMEITYFLDKFFTLDVSLREEFVNMMISLDKNMKVNIKEDKEIIVGLSYDMFIKTLCKKYMNVSIDKKDDIDLKDIVYFDITRWIDMNNILELEIYDKIELESKLNTNSIVYNKDEMQLNAASTHITSSNIQCTRQFKINKHLQETNDLQSNIYFEITYWVDIINKMIVEIYDNMTIKSTIAFNTKTNTNHSSLTNINLDNNDSVLVEETISLITTKE